MSPTEKTTQKTTIIPMQLVREVEELWEIAEIPDAIRQQVEKRNGAPGIKWSVFILELIQQFREGMTEGTPSNYKPEF